MNWIGNSSQVFKTSTKAYSVSHFERVRVNVAPVCKMWKYGEKMTRTTPVLISFSKA